MFSTTRCKTPTAVQKAKLFHISHRPRLWPSALCCGVFGRQTKKIFRNPGGITGERAGRTGYHPQKQAHSILIVRCGSLPLEYSHHKRPSSKPRHSCLRPLGHAASTCQEGDVRQYRDRGSLSRGGTSPHLPPPRMPCRGLPDSS